jgi:hypothetical protein
MNTRLAPQPRSTRRSDIIGMVVTVLLWAGATALMAPALRTPADVDEITIDNPHSWSVEITVTDRDRDGWVGIGGAGREREQTFQNVLDQGDTWTFRFAYAGEYAETRLSRSQLERDNWHVTVPEEFATRLRSAGVLETPP